MGYKTDWFKGIFPALVTPFAGNGSGQQSTFDQGAYRELIRWVLPHVNGVVPAGTTGEFSYLTSDERIQVIETAIDEVAGRVPVIAGTGAESTRETVRLTRIAKEAGASAALVLAPYYLKPSFNEVYDHFRAVDTVGLPIVLYNLPQCTGTHFKWWTAEGMLLDLDNVIGVKDTSGDVAFLAALFEKVRGEVGIFVGHDEVALAAFSSGADGAILASANLIPDVWQRIYRAVQDGDLEAARQDQQLVQKLVRIVTRTEAAALSAKTMRSYASSWRQPGSTRSARRLLPTTWAESELKPSSLPPRKRRALLMAGRSRWVKDLPDHRFRNWLTWTC